MRARTRGFSLIELMVSITIGLLITAAVVQIFAANRATYQLDEGLARMQENARFAIDFLNREIRQAGNMGCTRNATWFNNLNAGGPPTDFTVAIQGFDANGTGPGGTYVAASPTPSNSTGTWTPALNTSLIAGSNGSLGAIPGTDAIVVRHISSAPISTVPPYNSGSSLFLSAGAGTQLQVGQIAILTDCEKASVFQITSISSGGSGTTITHAASGSPGNQCVTWSGSSAGCPPGDQQYGPDSELSTVQTFAFYVARNLAGIPSLFVASLSGAGVMTPTELVEGVENMQIMYGVDNISDSGQQGDADQYMTAREVDAAGLWPKVVNARISLLMSTLNTTGAVADLQQDTGSYLLLGTNSATGVTVNPFDDNRRRRVFSTTILLRNRGA